MKQLIYILLAVMALTIVMCTTKFEPTDRELEHQHCDSLCECDGLGCSDTSHKCLDWEDSTFNPD